MTTVSISDHMQAVVDHLADLNIGRGAPPDAPHGWQGPPGVSPYIPYGIAWRIGSKDRIRWSLDGDFSRADILVFIRCFGGTVGEAEEHLDQVAARMFARHPETGEWALTIPGRHIIDVEQQNATTSTETPSTEVPLPEAGEFYAINTDPA